MVGDINGPIHNTCPKVDWIFNKSKCSTSVCASAKKIDHCIFPCKWSLNRQVCYYPRNFSKDSFEEILQKVEFSKIKKIFIISGLLIFCSILFSSILYLKNQSKPEYQILTSFNHFSLDDLPPNME